MRKILVIAFFFIICFITGCNDNDKKTINESLGENEYRIYCLNEAETRLIYNVCEIEAESSEALVLKVIELLSEDTDSEEYEPVIKEPIEVLEIKLISGRLYIYFNEEYYNMDDIQEVLVRAAMVKTLTQISGVERIMFYVNEKENEKNRLIASMEAADFIDDIEFNNYNTIRMTLYFTDENGMQLYAETREVNIDEKSSREKAVLDQLMLGPKTESLKKVLPEGLTIISVVTKDGICYLDLDDTFLTGSVNVVETIPVYAIVNSLTSLTGVEQVQFLINGEMGKVYREAIRFDNPLMPRKDLVADPE